MPGVWHVKMKVQWNFYIFLQKDFRSGTWDSFKVKHCWKNERLSREATSNYIFQRWGTKKYDNQWSESFFILG